MAPAAVVGAVFVIMDDSPTSPGTLRAEVGSSVDYPGPPTDEPTPDAKPTGDGSATPTSSPSGSPDSAEPTGAGGSDAPADDDTESDPPASPGEPGTDTLTTPEPAGSTPPSLAATLEPTPTPIPESPERPESTLEPTPTASSTPNPPQTPTDPPPPPEPPLPPEPVLSDAERALVEETNRVRVHAGCPELRVEARLTAAARGHSADMHDRWYTSHVSPDGSTPADRAAAQGYDGHVGETILYGSRNAERVVDEWTSRSGDRSELLDCAYTSVGIGVETGLLGAWWTQMLGRD